MVTRRTVLIGVPSSIVAKYLWKCARSEMKDGVQQRNAFMRMNANAKKRIIRRERECVLVCSVCVCVCVCVCDVDRIAQRDAIKSSLINQ